MHYQSEAKGKGKPWEPRDLIQSAVCRQVVELALLAVLDGVLEGGGKCINRVGRRGE
jgi:hypothetical protein